VSAARVPIHDARWRSAAAIERCMARALDRRAARAAPRAGIVRLARAFAVRALSVYALKHAAAARAARRTALGTLTIDAHEPEPSAHRRRAGISSDATRLADCSAGGALTLTHDTVVLRTGAAIVTRSGSAARLIGFAARAADVVGTSRAGPARGRARTTCFADTTAVLAHHADARQLGCTSGAAL
jgi:hypothetical protein